MMSPRRSSVPTSRAVMGGMLTLALLGFATVFGDSVLAWLSPASVAGNDSASAPAPLPGGPADGGSAVGRDG